MELAGETRDRIESLLASDDVVLFMKGTPARPEGGFSATVVQILDRVIPRYATVDVLAEPELREGIKAFSSWPTVPQLYVKGEFLGGCDIVRELSESGELFLRLGVDPASISAPTIQVSDAAAPALKRIVEEATEGKVLHLQVRGSFENSLYTAVREAGTLEVESNGVRIHVDPGTVSRAQGLRIDLVETDEGPGFKIENPNAPQVRQLTPQELDRMRGSGEPHLLFDVRTPQEAEQASIEGARLVTPEIARSIEKLDKDAVLVFHCHHGGRSQQAAEHYLSLGFRDVSNLVGGIDAWSRDVDASVRRY